MTCPCALSTPTTLCPAPTCDVPTSKISHRQGGSVGKWSKEDFESWETCVEYWVTGQSSNFLLAKSCFPLQQLLGICWSAPHTPNRSFSHLLATSLHLQPSDGTFTLYWNSETPAMKIHVSKKGHCPCLPALLPSPPTSPDVSSQYNAVKKTLSCWGTG